MHEVTVPLADPHVLTRVLPAERIDSLLVDGDRLRTALAGAAVISINSTAAGGGVAEMLTGLLSYARGVGIDARWLVIEGDERFFAITKRLHNHLYGTSGDGGALGSDEHAHYEGVLRENAARLADVVRPGDVVLLHDPQPAGLAAAMHARGARVVWRCHVGTDTRNSHTDVGWEFLRRYLEPPNVDAYVFTRRAFAPTWLPTSLVHEIPPSIDPFSPKNIEVSSEDTVAILSSVGLLAPGATTATYERGDGTRRRIDRGVDLVCNGRLPGPDVPLVVQVSRWDRLKDMIGVLQGFAELVTGDRDAHLVLAGPAVSAVSDDPEGADVLRECWETWRQLPHHVRRRATLACIPMDDLEENAVIVNALQRHATVVVQKSLAEGFGLTVSEAMYKRRPVVASAVGGIADQVVDGESGVLLHDPTDLDAFAQTLSQLLGDPHRLATIGEAAHERVLDRFLPDSQLARWSALLLAMATADHVAPPQ